MPQVHVCGMFTKLPAGARVVNVCSNGSGWAAELSPFVAQEKPIQLYDGWKSWTMENAWQFSKVYHSHVDNDGEPTSEYWGWATEGWLDRKAHRYPMGKGAIPEYSLWDGEKLGYIDARKRIYGPLYLRSIMHRPALYKLLSSDRPVWLRDYDGYVTDDDLSVVLNNPKKKMGHAFFIKAWVEQHPMLGELQWV